MCKLKVEGGLGLGTISLRSKALLSKWLWRSLREINTFWREVILSIYGFHFNGWDTIAMIKWSHHCRWKIFSQVINDCSILVGDDTKICFGKIFVWVSNLAHVLISKFL